MTKCYIKHCKGEAEYTIKDAVQFPKKYNGKKICEDCNRARILLKTEPEVDQDE